jgi:hypothetical protein
MHIFCDVAILKNLACLYTRIIVEFSDAYVIYFEGWQADAYKSMNICMQQISEVLTKNEMLLTR